MIYVEFMKNFLLADSSKHMAVRLISASSEQKRFNPLFRHDDIMYVEFMKNFLLPIRAGSWLLDSIRPPEPENVWILLSRHDARLAHEQFSSRWLEQAHGY